MTARLATGVWVSAYLRLLEAAGLPAYVTARGDGTAGAVAVKLARLDGRAAWMERRHDLDSGRRVWAVALEGPEAEVDAALARARLRDRDLWILEVEAREGLALLDTEAAGL